MKLTLDKASIIATKRWRRALKIRPLCVAVLDDGGTLKALKREDGASVLRPAIATGKAWGAIGMGESSRSLENRLKERPAFLGALSDMSGGKVVPVPGGVLIMEANEIIGAAGASGASADITGIQAAGLQHKI
jgi:uncharacterized protein GlcG (DUF336 family)